AKRQTKSGSTKTAVNTNPQMKDAKAMTVDKGTKGFDRNNRPNDHRSSVDFPRPQPISPTNPQPPRNPGLVDMWKKADLEAEREPHNVGRVRIIQTGNHDDTLRTLPERHH